MSKFIRNIGLLCLLSLIQGNRSADRLFFEPYDITLAGSSEKISMTPISGGLFLRGAKESPDTSPVQNITLGDFWIGTHEITWDQYELFLYREIDHVKGQPGSVSLEIDGISGATMPYVNFNKPGYPAICITQYAASQFCKWLTAKTGEFYRLPTEAEWEYACRAGTDTDYSISEKQISDYAWFNDNSQGQLQMGGKKLPNPWGLFDMHGNAAEWVLDTYKSGYHHLSTVSENPFYVEEELYPHVVRGGSFKDPKEKIRSSFRDYSTPSWKKQDPQFPKSLWWHTDATHVGFRIVRPLKTPAPSEMDFFWINPIEEY